MALPSMHSSQQEGSPIGDGEVEDFRRPLIKLPIAENIRNLKVGLALAFNFGALRSRCGVGSCMHARPGPSGGSHSLHAIIIHLHTTKSSTTKHLIRALRIAGALSARHL